MGSLISITMKHNETVEKYTENILYSYVSAIPFIVVSKSLNANGQVPM